jgi:hypothetical protein
VYWGKKRLGGGDSARKLLNAMLWLAKFISRPAAIDQLVGRAGARTSKEYMRTDLSCPNPHTCTFLDLQYLSWGMALGAKIVLQIASQL